MPLLKYTGYLQFLGISLKPCNSFSASERPLMHRWHLLFKADGKVRELITVSFNYTPHSITNRHFLQVEFIKHSTQLCK